MASIAGHVAAITWAYYTAASIEGFTITHDPDHRRWIVEGTIVICDPFKMTQRPLFLVVPFTGGRWRFPILDPIPVVRRPGPFGAALGAPVQEGSSRVVLDAQTRGGTDPVVT